METSTANQKTKISTPAGRLASIDALRGFDMLMISGGGSFLFLLGGKTGVPAIDAVSAQFEHPEWHGFAFYDFIFPLFLFLAGSSLSFSVTNALSRGIERQKVIRKMFNRMLILMFLGILDKNAPTDFFDPAHIRYGSVLGRIGLATFVGLLLYLNFTFMQRAVISAAVLLGYYLLLILVPVPGFGAGDLSFEGNLVGWVDRNLMPGRLRQGTFDELALLTQLPAICLTIFGSLAGDVLLDKSEGSHKLARLCGFGLVLILVGLVWNVVFPINKHLWSSSFICLTAGMSFLALTLFYWVIDVKGWTKWSFFFRVIGMNSLVIYLVMRFVDLNASSRLLFEGIYKYAGRQWMDVYNALCSLLIVWLFLYFLYKHKIFVKL